MKKVADNGDIVIGDNMLKRLHNTRRKFFIDYNPKGWKYSLDNNNMYKIYLMSNDILPNRE